MARAANLGGIGRPGLRERIEAKIEAEIVAAKVVRVAMTGVPVVADLKDVMKVAPAAVVVRSTTSQKSSWRS